MKKPVPVLKDAILPVLLLIAVSFGMAPADESAADEQLFISSVFLPTGKFTTGIEGPACDAGGNLYAVSYGNPNAIGMVIPGGIASLFVELPAGSAGNGIRFDSRGNMLIADYTGHNVLRVDMKTRAISVLAHESAMTQPNDIAITTGDIVFASDPSGTTGRIWRITPDGAVTLIASGLGTTNGIEVSPDERTLYVGESRQNNVQAFDISPAGEISNKRLLINLPATSLDGMRCDMAGNLYVTRKGSATGTIAIVSPGGTLLREVTLSGRGPSNIAFGGPDGRTCYVMMANNGSIDTFRTDTPGREWQMWQDRMNLAVAEHPVSPRALTLSGNFPNPFNASTVIEYTLHRDAEVELAVYNMAGQRIANLGESREKAGRHAVFWNAGNLPSGVYFAQVNAGGSKDTRKMLLLR
jgi:sugar lactone lactonase YvrE